MSPHLRQALRSVALDFHRVWEKPRSMFGVG
jgi:hypothetical protein